MSAKPESKWVKMIMIIAKLSEIKQASRNYNELQKFKLYSLLLLCFIFR